jgi:hypothetical protein
MPDNIQPTGFSQGVSTPRITGLEQASFKNGYSTRSIDTTIAYSGSGVGELSYSLGSAVSLQGTWAFRFTIGGVSANVVVAANAKIGATPLKMDNEVEVLGFSSDDETVLKFKKAFLVTSAGVIHLVVNFYVDSVSTVVSATVSSFGQSAPVAPVAYSTISAPAAFTHRYLVSPDVMQVNQFRDTSAVNIDLNAQRKPGTFSCNPATAGSRPADQDGFGSCLVYGGTAGLGLAQLYTGNNGFCFIRSSSNGGNTWTDWASLGDTSSLAFKVDRTSRINHATTSLNAVTLSGFYDFTSAPANAPSGFSGPGSLIATFSALNCNQLIFDLSGRIWSRSGIFGGGLWSYSPWFQIAGFDEKVDKSNSSASIDANALLITGFYRATTSMTNVPAGSSGKDTIIVSNNASVTTQILINTDNGRMWSRAGTTTGGTTTWTDWIRNVGFDELQAYTDPTPARQNAFNRGGILPFTNNGVVVCGAKYPVNVTAASAMFLPLKANTQVGDKVTFLNVSMSWAKAIPNRFTLKRQESNTFIHGYDEDLDFDQNVGEVSATCVSNSGGVASWIIS